MRVRTHCGCAALAALTIVIAVAAVLVCGCGKDAATVAGQADVTTSACCEGAGSTEPAPSITVTGPDGTKSFNMARLRAIEAVQGYGGFTCPPHPGVTGPTQFAGVALTDLLETVGGLSDHSVVSVAATDGYVMTFTTDQIVNGTFVTYDPVTGSEAKVEDAPQPVIAYESDGVALGDDEGPFRLVFLTPDPEQVVEGYLWVKWVTRIQMRDVDDDWTLELDGTSHVTLDRESFGKLATAEGIGAEWEDIQGRTWSGVPLRVLVDLVTGGESGGYTVEIVGLGGSNVTLDSAEVAGSSDYVVADKMLGNPLGDRDFPVSLVGSGVASGGYLSDAERFVGGIKEIRVHLK